MRFLTADGDTERRRGGPPLRQVDREPQPRQERVEAQGPMCTRQLPRRKSKMGFSDGKSCLDLSVSTVGLELL